MDIQTNEIIARELSMPHSPRWYQGKLWLLNSGAGDFGYINKGEFVPVTFCPGYARGLAFVGNFAVVGLSKLRDTTFLGLGLNERLQQKDVDARCGVRIIDLTSGDIVHWLDIDLGCFTSKSSVKTEGSELYDVAVLPGVRCPMAVGSKSGNISKLITIGSSSVSGNYNLLSLSNFHSPEAVNISDKKPETDTLQKRNSQKSMAYFNQGQDLKRAGKIDEAIVYFQKAIQVDSQNFTAYNNLGTIFQAKG